MDDKMKCPFCGERIAALAVKCRYCKEWIGKTQKTDSAMARAVSRGIKQKNFSKIAFKARLILLLGALALVANAIDKIAWKYFHLNSLLAAPSWIKGFVIISLLLVAIGFVWKFIRQYYEE